MIYSLCVAPNDLICCKTFFSIFFQMDTLFFFVQKISFQVLCKWVAICLTCSIILISQVLCKLVPMSYFLKISVKLQIADPTHKQFKYVQSSINNKKIPNKPITNQPNCFKSTKFEVLAWNQQCLGSFMEILK